MEISLFFRIAEECMNENRQYERIPFEDEALPIRINFASKLFPPGGNRVPMARLSWHEQIELLYFRRGGAVVHCGDKMCHVEDQDIILVNPYEMHQVEYESGEPEYDCLMIDASLYRNTQQGVCEARYFDLLSDSHVIRFENHIHRDPELIAHIRALCTELQEKQVAYELAIKSHVFGLFACLFRNYISSGSAFQHLIENIGQYDRIRPALEYMQANLSEHIPVDALAQACNVSLSHFCRLFRQITGKTAIQYLTDVRLQKAASLLKGSEKPVAEIAADVGIDDVSYLSRKFKQQFGLTPMQAKKKAAAEASSGTNHGEVDIT